MKFIAKITLFSLLLGNVCLQASNKENPEREFIFDQHKNYPLYMMNQYVSGKQTMENIANEVSKLSTEYAERDLGAVLNNFFDSAYNSVGSRDREILDENRNNSQRRLYENVKFINSVAQALKVLIKEDSTLTEQEKKSIESARESVHKLNDAVEAWQMFIELRYKAIENQRAKS